MSGIGIRATMGMLLISASLASAQYVVGARAGTIEWAAGDVFVDANQFNRQPLHFPVLQEGQALWTERGRAEVLLSPGVFVRLGERSAVRLVNGEVDDAVVEVRKGPVLVEAVEALKQDLVRIQYGSVRTELHGMGLYRFEGDSGNLLVFGGEALVSAAGKEVSAARGSMVHLADDLTVSKFSAGKHDALHTWAARRSFDLYVGSREAMRKRTNWEYTSLGWFWNSDYGMQFRVRASIRDLVPPERVETPQ